MIMNKKVAIDSNIFLYALDLTLTVKGEIALNIILQNDAHFSSQAFSEIINVCKKRWKFTKPQLIQIATFLTKNARLDCLTETVILKAHDLIIKYQFQYFDAIIVATALQSNCIILYSEDMHNGLVIDDRHTIENPFL
jgi:predicted nucleic acid-binding protein